jgi:hypothetical protein
MSLSLDGFVAGPHVSVHQPMGEDRDRIHDWMFKGKTDREAEAWEEERFADIGAVIMGNRTFEVGVGPWGDHPTIHAPCFVVSQLMRTTQIYALPDFPEQGGDWAQRILCLPSGGFHLGMIHGD